MKSLLALLILGCIASISFAGGIVPVDCQFEAKDMDYSFSAEQELWHIQLKNKLSHCGELNLKLLVFTKEKNAPLLNALTNAITPPELLPLKKDPKLALALLPAKFKKDEYTYYYEEKADWLTDEIFSLTQTIYVFTGGAHGNTSVHKLSFNLKTKKQYTLNTVFKKDSIAGLMLLAKAEFMKAHQLEEGKTLKEQGFWFKAEDNVEHKPWVTEDGFYLPENFNLNEKGITFSYQQYEIAPYSYGILEFTIPWEALKNYLLVENIKQ